MIESADWLCQKHFNKPLIDKNVEILDPAAGTGTFITELIEHFRGQRQKLRHKYLEELHANEVAILPSYVANLNIEATYAAINGFEEYPNLCFVDTLDNVAGLPTHAIAKNQHFGDLFGAMSEENVARIKRQNKKKISVVIGNPPYNANQMNENENNKNREYPAMDQRIKETYIDASTAQKTKLYDMFVRFFRWASDRVDENGIVAFVSNSTFIDSRTFDGFRKIVSDEFNEIWIIDLKGNARTSGEHRRQEGGNVFDDQIRVGIAIYFCIKKRGLSGCRIRYEPVRDYAKSDEKREFLQARRLEQRQFEEIKPDRKNNWINLVDNDFNTLIPTASKETKLAKQASQERAIFKLYTLGVVTARDDWMYDFDGDHLGQKVRYLIKTYNSDLDRIGGKGSKKDISAELDAAIKWTRAVKRDLGNGISYKFGDKKIVRANYRPFVSEWLYRDNHLNEMPYQTPLIFGDGYIRNPAITVMGDSTGKPYFCLAIDRIPDLNFVSPASGGTQTLALHRLDSSGSKIVNITNWALDQFRAHFEKDKKPKRLITKDAIFHYIYGVLHDPVYREKYALNLKREFPRIPFYGDFWKWAEWGEKLMALHIGYETVEPWPLERIDAPEEKSRKAGIAPKAMLRANKDGEHPARQRDAIGRSAAGGVDLQARQSLGTRMDSRPAQGKDAE